MRLYDGNNSSGNLLAEMTNYIEPGTNISSYGNEMHVVFYSDSAYIEKGYIAKIHIIEPPYRPGPGKLGHCTSYYLCGANEGDCQNDDQCLLGHHCALNSCPLDLGFADGTNCCQDMSCGLLDMKNGVLLSPNYPNNYQVGLNCSHQISTDPGNWIIIEFVEFEVSQLP